jgi:D-alanyl-D-alanine dipeptidase
MTTPVNSNPIALTESDYVARMTRVVREALAAGLNGVIVTPGPDLRWLTGYQPTAITERLTMLVLSPMFRPTLVVPALERPDAEAAGGAAAFDIVPWADGTDPYQLANQLLQPYGRFGISDSTWSTHLIGLQQTLPNTRYAALSDCLPLLRAVKDAGELARLTIAGAAADAAYDEIIRMPFAGRCEFEVAAMLDQLLRDFGHEQVDFTVVGSGPNGANPHHEAGRRVIAPGDVVVLDFGGLMLGYGSDTSRTVCVGEPSAEVRVVHDVVRAAQEAAFQAVAPDVPCEEIDRIARTVITESGYGELFIHRTGHGIGVTTHEPPYLVDGSTHLLRPGMCFSIEPGIYLAGRFGVRIEDIVTVTEDGAVRLNNTDRTLCVVS